MKNTSFASAECLYGVIREGLIITGKSEVNKKAVISETKRLCHVSHLDFFFSIPKTCVIWRNV